MKKIATVVIMIIAALICSFSFVACSNTDVSLAMDKRYIYDGAVNKDAEKQIFYVFHRDSTGEYTYHYDGTYEHYHYIIHFKYTYVDGEKSAVVCLYDSLERLDGDDGSSISTRWSELVSASKNVLATVGSKGYIFWINEDYLKELPNFGKPSTKNRGQ